MNIKNYFWNNSYNELGRKKNIALHLNIFQEKIKNYCMKETYKQKLLNQI